MSEDRTLRQVDKLVGRSDWNTWKKMVSLHFIKADLLGYVNGTNTCPEPPAATTTAQERADIEKQRVTFVKKDAQALLDIMTCVSDEMKTVILACTTAKEAWDQLISVHEQTDDHRLDRLLTEFYKWERDPSEEIVMHVARLQKHFHELNNAL